VVHRKQHRCQAAFPHSIMLGLFWATLIPVFVGLSRSRRHRYMFWAATGSCIFIVYATASSTPLLTLLIVLFLIPLFHFRRYGRQIAYCACAMIFALHVVMNKPVWHLLCRINIIGGSTGWHRYLLIDKVIKHFNEWALLGTQDTAHWGRGLSDLTNQYILEGIRGGLVTLLLFVALLTTALRTVYKYSLSTVTETKQWFAWCLCVSILGHCVSFIGVSYFGQIMMLLYLTFAIVSLIYDLSSRKTLEQSVLNLSGLT